MGEGYVFRRARSDILGESDPALFCEGEVG